MARNAIGLVIGLFVAFVVTWSIQSVNYRLYPLPAGLEAGDYEGMKAFMKTLPATAFIVLLLSHSAASFLGAMAATKIADNYQKYISLAIATFLLFMGIAQMLMMPHPTWYMIADLFMYVPFAYLGYRMMAS